MTKTATSPAYTSGTWQVACDSYGKVQHSKMACVWRGSSTQEPIITIAQRIKNWHDARLIAAAPDLLAACKQALEDGDDYAAMQSLKAAIAKAEGRG